MKRIFIALLLLYSIAANATKYYVSNAGSDANNGTSSATSWLTVSRVKTAGNNGTIVAGDSILFKRGDTFTGAMYWSTLFGNTAVSGTISNPITFTTYGTGAQPIFQLAPNGGLVAPLLSFVGVNYIIVDGFNVTDLSFPLGDKVNPANCGNGIELGSYNQIKSNNCTIRNCTFSNIGAPVVIIGNFNTVDSCTMTNLKNIKNTPGIPGQPNTYIDDFGANGITITGNDNIIKHSYFSGNWASSYDFGYNGGAFEMFDSCSRNKFLYNTITDCGGVAEFGAAVVNAIATDNLYAYNKIINCGLINWCNLTGSYTTNVNNTQYFNNVIIENNLSRFSGPNNGAGVTTNPPATLQSFSYNGSPSTTVYNLKNNIFQLSSGINVLSTYAVPKTTHANNIYKLSNGGVTNFTPGASEVSTSAILFANTTNTDATLWDFNLIAGSPGIAFGQSVSLTPDFAGVAVATPPNAGVYDTRPATSSVRTRILMTFQPVTGRAGFPLLDTVREVISSLMYDSLKHLYVDTSIRRNGYLLAFDSVNHKWYLAPGTASTGGTVTNIATGLGLLGGQITTTGTILVDTSSASILSRQRAAATYQPSLNLTTTGTGASTLVGSTLNIPVPTGTTYTGNAPVIVAGSVISADTTTRYTGLATIGKAVGDSNVLRAIINTNTANILLKLNISDTGAMLSPYLRTNIATSTYQPKISLTTTGTSGAATFVSNVLNVPQYTGGTPAGTNSSIQFNNSGAFGASDQLYWDGLKLNARNSTTSSQLRIGFPGYSDAYIYDIGRHTGTGYLEFSGVTNPGYSFPTGPIILGATAIVAAPSAILDIRSTTKGVSFPSMTTTQKNAIASPVTGLIIFDITLLTFQYYNGSSWVGLNSSTDFLDARNLTNYQVRVGLTGALDVYTYSFGRHGGSGLLEFKGAGAGGATEGYSFQSGSVVISGGLGTGPNASAILDLNTSTKGFLPPRMTTTQRDAIASPATMLKISNTTQGADNTYNGVNWTGGLIIDGGGTLTLLHGTDYIFTGTTATWTLPAVSAATVGSQNGIKIKNRGTGSITLNSNAGSTLYNTAAQSTITITAGTSAQLLPDGTYFNIL